MAVLVDVNTQQCCFLYAHHSFGRLTYAVDTVIPRQQISKHHAIIEWHDEKWFIRDLSSNGTWVNHHKLEQNNRYPLSINDNIGFADPENFSFKVVDLSAPCDLLIPQPLSVNNFDQAIRLEPYHLLPDEQHPQVAVFFDSRAQHWCIEPLEQTNESTVILNENGLVEFGGQSWQLKLSHFEAKTSSLEFVQYNIDQFHHWLFCI